MSKDDYDVGHGKPPKNTRWKKGESGNPKGRPKGHKNMRTIVNEIQNRTVTITENGRTRTMPLMEAITHQMAAKALNGSARDRSMFFKMLDDFAPEAAKEVEPPQDITVRYVLPEGKTLEDYDNADRSLDTLAGDPNILPTEEQTDPHSDEDESWLN